MEEDGTAEASKPCAGDLAVLVGLGILGLAKGLAQELVAGPIGKLMLCRAVEDSLAAAARLEVGLLLEADTAAVVGRMRFWEQRDFLGHGGRVLLRLRDS